MDHPIPARIRRLRAWLLAAFLVILARLQIRESVVIGLLAFCFFLPPALSVLQLNPDVVEYVDVARRLLHGDCDVRRPMAHRPQADGCSGGAAGEDRHDSVSDEPGLTVH